MKVLNCLFAVSLAQTESVFCRDKFLKCPQYKQSCSASSRLQNMCQKTCNTCTKLEARSTFGFKECTDDYAVCDNITKEQCTNDSIKVGCRKTCGTCQVSIKPVENEQCQDASWCGGIFSGHCQEPEFVATKAKYGAHCPIECKKPECEFAWGARMNESKKDTDGCRDISKVCVELIETVPGICQSKENTMTHYCQQSCGRCDVIVADEIEPLKCVDFRSNCDRQNLLEKKLGLPIKECTPTRPDESILIKQRKLTFQNLCRKTCGLCDDVIFGRKEANTYHDPLCGSVHTPDCAHLAPICASQPLRCVYGCTLCKKRTDIVDLLIPEKERTVCKDKKKTCPKWRCKQPKYGHIMKKYCAKTCGACQQ